MLRSGGTAIRTREWMDVLARKLGLEAVSVGFSFDSITAAVRHSGNWVTAVRELGPPGINAGRIGELRLPRQLLQQGQRLRLQGIEFEWVGSIYQYGNSPWAPGSEGRTLATRPRYRQRPMRPLG